MADREHAMDDTIEIDDGDPPARDAGLEREPDGRRDRPSLEPDAVVDRAEIDARVGLGPDLLGEDLGRVEHHGVDGRGLLDLGQGLDALDPTPAAASAGPGDDLVGGQDWDLVGTITGESVSGQVDKVITGGAAPKGGHNGYSDADAPASDPVTADDVAEVVQAQGGNIDFAEDDGMGAGPLKVSNQDLAGDPQGGDDAGVPGATGDGPHLPGNIDFGDVNDPLQAPPPGGGMSTVATTPGTQTEDEIYVGVQPKGGGGNVSSTGGDDDLWDLEVQRLTGGGPRALEADLDADLSAGTDLAAPGGSVLELDDDMEATPGFGDDDGEGVPDDFG